MEFDLGTLGNLASLVIGAISLLVVRTLEKKTKELNHSEGESRGIIKKLADRIEVLEIQADAKRIEFRELEWRYEALKIRYEELSEAHRAAEEANRQLRDRLLMHYLDGTEAHRTLPPPPAVPREMLEYAKGK